MGQTSYSFKTPVGVPGGIYDLNDYVANSRSNEEADGILKCGCGVVVGTTPGALIKKPDAESAATDFEGVVMNGGTTELGQDKTMQIAYKATIGVMSKGRIYVRVGDDAVPAYGKNAYLITDGEESGCFTTDDDASTKIAVSARFLAEESNGLAVLELFGATATHVAAALVNPTESVEDVT